MMSKVIFYYLTFRFILIKKVYIFFDWLSELFCFANGSAILMFHHVRNDNPINISSSCLSTEAEFIELMEFIVKNKQVVSLDELFKLIEHKRVKNNIVITFDDIPDNVFTTAYPILKRMGLPFTVYITTDYIGKEGYISKEQLSILSKDELCTIGSHTISHPRLRNKGVDDSRELIDSKIILEKIIGKPVLHFAYPFGTPYAVSCRNIKTAGSYYKTAVSAIPGMINCLSVSNKYYLPRIYNRLYMKNYQNK